MTDMIDDINLEAIWKEADELIHRMQNDARKLHMLTWEEPAFKEITDRCNKVWNHLGDMQLALAERKAEFAEKVRK